MRANRWSCAIAVVMAMGGLRGDPARSQCVDPTAVPRAIQEIPAATPVAPDADCAAGFERWSLGGADYCVAPCADASAEQVLYDGIVVCLAGCPEGSFRQYGEGQERYCYSCPPGTIWCESFQQCCLFQETPDPGACGNYGRGGTVSGGAGGLIRVREGTHIRIVSVEGYATAYDPELGEWVEIHEGDVLRSGMTIYSRPGGQVTWERIQSSPSPRNPGSALAAAALDAPFDLESGTGVIEQSGTCSGAENCGFLLAGSVAALSSDTVDGDVVGFQVDMAESGETALVTNFEFSSKPVLIVSLSGEVLNAVPPGEETVVYLGAIAARPSTWGALKKLYR